MKLLDLFCGGGGAARGYASAGFEVVGVDANAAARRHYPFEFHCGDALDYVREHSHEFDAIHASPPCQAYSVTRSLNKGREYPDLVAATREALVATGKPYVIENVPGAPLGGGTSYLLLLCGTMFGLATPDGRAEIRRHRLFETNWCFGLRPQCQHDEWTITVAGHDIHSMKARRRRRAALCIAGDHPHDPAARHRNQALRRRALSVTGNTAQINLVRETFAVEDARAAMGLDLPMRWLSQAIPPAYTRWIGERLRSHLEEACAH